MQTNGKMLLAAFMLSAAGTTAMAGPDEMEPGTFAANIAVTNDYVFRGFTQTQEDWAVQGGFDWYSLGGVYFGTSASNIEFGIPGEGDFKLDVYGGYKGQIENFSYDVGAIKYFYPSSAKALEYDWYEVSGKVGYDFGVAKVSAGVAYTPDFFGGLDDGFYYSGKVKVPLNFGGMGLEGLSVDGTIGYQDLKTGFDSIADYSVGVTYAMQWFTTDVRFVDTDGDKIGCRKVCDSRVVVKVSRSF